MGYSHTIKNLWDKLKVKYMCWKELTINAEDIKLKEYTSESLYNYIRNLYYDRKKR